MQVSTVHSGGKTVGDIKLPSSYILRKYHFTILFFLVGSTIIFNKFIDKHRPGTITIIIGAILVNVEHEVEEEVPRVFGDPFYGAAS